MVAHRVIHLLEVIEVYHQKRHLSTVSPRTLNSAGHPVLEQTAVRQSSQRVMQSQVLVVFYLVFQQQKHHADSHDKFWQVPHFALDVNLGLKRPHHRHHNEDRRPGKKPTMVTNAPAVARRKAWAKKMQQPR